MRNVLAAVVVLGPVLTATAVSAQEGAHPWSYRGDTGPSHWASLKSDYQQCKVGKHQSPIDIHSAKPTSLPAIEFSYQAAPLKIVDNGHTVQVNVPAGSFITVGGKRYELVQFHFHHPSENEVNGRKFSMELHLVHQDADGKLAVVSVLLTDGKANPVVAELWKNLPKDKEKESAPDGVTVDPSGLLPTNHAYYTFVGSLTTPPCSEDVTWLVLRTPGTLSKDEVATFAAEYPNNARPVQPLNGRKLEKSK